jgi:hypothetical protein
VRTGKGEPAVLRFLGISITRTGLNFLKTNVDTLPQCLKKKFGGEPYLADAILCENRTQQVS